MKKPLTGMQLSSSSSVVSELEGMLLKDNHPFCYFMLVAFEAAGLIRFILLLLLWPAVSLLDALGMADIALQLTVFVALAGLRISEVEAVARAVLPKFYMDDVNIEAWRVFSQHEKRVVVTSMPTIMAERFVKEHLMADEVIGNELLVNRFGFATGFIRKDVGTIAERAAKFFRDENPCLGSGKSNTITGSSFLFLCKGQAHPPFTTIKNHPRDRQFIRPLPVIFHDGRLVNRPTPLTALIILLWIPLGIVLALIRIVSGLILPLWALPYITAIFGGKVIVNGKPPPPATHTNGGVLFVCTHRTLLDPVILSFILQRKIPAVTYSISRISEILSPIPTIRLTRIRQVDAEKIKSQLQKDDVVVCPEGTTCREPFLLRFSALFAELTDRIVPVAMNYKVKAGFFHATTARGWKALDPFFFFMNPQPTYEVTFLNQLPTKSTCSAGKSPHDVANYVQRILAATLGFECTNFTRKDKYKLLVGTDGTVSYPA
ncbi:hypothetical protein Nepgr_006098 [Nepenthes gracilis]|uniref:Phospholipid/glycerol acyltransferase domain-containing protein n=1 Tax=Nepenthes gracilis TaxID=150966 RepID=A0AAD3XH08_NEPGR|nr:hypothetical protein Nepgr_006098 [Nepenthes gracilis]